MSIKSRSSCLENGVVNKISFSMVERGVVKKVSFCLPGKRAWSKNQCQDSQQISFRMVGKRGFSCSHPSTRTHDKTAVFSTRKKPVKKSFTFFY
jgi:hypothetical protein